MEKCIILWDSDIGWSEKLYKELAKEDTFVMEAEGMECFGQTEGLEGRLKELLAAVGREGAVAVVLSAVQLAEEGQNQQKEGAEYTDIWQIYLQDFCRKCQVPVILISEGYDEAAELAALQAGVCDFVDRQRDIRICVRRILMCGRRNGQTSAIEGESDDQLFLDEKRQCVICNGRECALTQKEFQVLGVLWNQRGELVTRQELLTAVWGEKPPKCSRVIDTIMKQLRVKIKETPYVIQSKYKQGYYLSRYSG